jgi:hypothetical protein
MSGSSTFFLIFPVKKVSKIIKGKIGRCLTSFLTKEAIMRISYARASTQDQNFDLQKDALKRPAAQW